MKSFLPIYVLLIGAILWTGYGYLNQKPGNYLGGWSDRDCRDFNTQQEAQAFYRSAGPGGPHGLDRDNDGIACEWNPR